VEKLTDWLGSCSFDDDYFAPADEACRKLITPFFLQIPPAGLEVMITTTLKLYKEVQYIRDVVLTEVVNVNYVSRKEFARAVMAAWRDRNRESANIVEAICYEMEW
jgi:hypothetical protein